MPDFDLVAAAGFDIGGGRDRAPVVEVFESANGHHQSQRPGGRGSSGGAAGSRDRNPRGAVASGGLDNIRLATSSMIGVASIPLHTDRVSQWPVQVMLELHHEPIQLILLPTPRVRRCTQDLADDNIGGARA